jgi:drug/metabolite transporter (DMT)-like permease
MMTPSHITLRTAFLTFITLIAFASNSILCRLALGARLIDAGTFTCVRLLSGAIVLALLVALRDRGVPKLHTRRTAALALFVYAAPFSFAYLRIPAGVGALVLFGAVQATMIGSDLVKGKRLHAAEMLGLLLAVAGLVALTLPGASAPDPVGTGLMAVAGVAWGVYSLRGRGIADPLKATAGNFVLSLLFALPLALVSVGGESATTTGLAYAVASGALASGLGYALWYTALRGLSATQAGIVQLLVPVLAAIGGALFLGETVSARLLISGAIILSGVGLVVAGRR